MSTRSVGTNWRRGLDIALVGWPIGVSLLAFAGILFGASVAGGSSIGVLGGMAGIISVVVLALPVVGLLVGIVLAVSLYKDASSINESSVEWSPSPVLYAIGGLFIPLVGYNYLWQRYNYLPRPSHDRVW